MFNFKIFVTFIYTVIVVIIRILLLWLYCHELVYLEICNTGFGRVYRIRVEIGNTFKGGKNMAGRTK